MKISSSAAHQSLGRGFRIEMEKGWFAILIKIIDPPARGDSPQKANLRPTSRDWPGMGDHVGSAK